MLRCLEEFRIIHDYLRYVKPFLAVQMTTQVIRCIFIMVGCKDIALRVNDLVDTDVPFHSFVPLRIRSRFGHSPLHCV